MERRIQGIVDVGHQSEETRPIRYPALKNGPHGALFRYWVLFVYNLVIPRLSEGFLHIIDFFDLFLRHWVSPDLIGSPAHLVRLPFSIFLSGEHARPYTQASGSEGLGQAQLRSSGF